jgi:hypothetical protein
MRRLCQELRMVESALPIEVAQSHETHGARG